MGRDPGIAREAGRDPSAPIGAVYLTLAIDENAAQADARMNAFIESYYGRPAAEMRARQAAYAGPAEGAAAWLSSWAQAGVEPPSAALRRRPPPPPRRHRQAAR